MRDVSRPVPSLRRWMVAALGGGWLGAAAAFAGPPPPGPAGAIDLAGRSAAPATVPGPRPAPASSPRAVAATAPTPVTATVPAPAFLDARTVVWQDRSRVIPFQVAAAPGVDTLLPVVVSDPGVVRVLRQPAVLAGEKTGFLRVVGLRRGQAQLRFEDDPRRAPLLVEVRDDAADPAAEAAPPWIVGPAAGAVVWGRVTVGVETWAEPAALRAASDDSAAAAGSRRVGLRLPDGTELEPVSATYPEQGPVRRLTFEFDAGRLPAGPLDLRPVVHRVAAAGAAPQLLAGEPVRVWVSHPPASGNAVPWVVPCAAAAGPQPEALAPARPAGRFGARQPRTGPLPGTLNRLAVLCPGENPAWSTVWVVPAAGRYQLFLRARGDLAAGALPSVALFLNYQTDPAATARLVSERWHRLPVGPPLTFPAGPQLLTVQFKNDFAVGKEDRNLYLDELEVARVPDPPAAAAAPAATTAHPPAAPPGAAGALPSLSPDAGPRLLYPREGQSLAEADVVVAELPPGTAPAAWADVLLDGRPLGLPWPHPLPGQALVFPLPVRRLLGRADGTGLPAGPLNAHRLAVRTVSADGREADSPARSVWFAATPAAAAAADSALGSYAHAVRLLERFAYGPDPRELARLLTRGEEAWWEARLGPGAGALPSAADQRLLAAAFARYPNLDDANQTVRRVLAQLLGTDNPVRARFALWAENHFSTWIQKTGPAAKWHEHQAFFHLGPAPFADLLAASAHSPAMLVYLDQEKSFAGRLNENYARELLELHTVGVHGGYRQADVTRLAGLLTGWTLASEARLPGSPAAGNSPDPAAAPSNAGLPAAAVGLDKGFRYDPLLNDGRPDRVLGLELPPALPAARYDRVSFVLEMLADHPATAEHLGRQLAAHYLVDPPPDTLVRSLARVFRESGGDLRAVLRALAAADPALAVAAAPPGGAAPAPRLATPQDYALRLGRLLAAYDPTPDGRQTPRPETVQDFLNRSGMGLFDRVSPDGYPDHDAAYADSNALLQRWRFAQGLAPLIRAALVPPNWAPLRPPGADGTTLAPDPEGVSRWIDAVAIRITGHLLGTRSEEAVRQLVSGPGVNADSFAQAALLVTLLPEANLR